MIFLNIPEFFKSLKCLGSNDLSPIHLCMDKYIVQMENLANITGDNRIAATCCSFHMLRQCAREKVSKVCQNKEAIEYLGNLITEAVCL